MPTWFILLYTIRKEYGVEYNERVIKEAFSTLAKFKRRWITHTSDTPLLLPTILWFYDIPTKSWVDLALLSHAHPSNILSSSLLSQSNLYTYHWVTLPHHKCWRWKWKYTAFKNKNIKAKTVKNTPEVHTVYHWLNNILQGFNQNLIRKLGVALWIFTVWQVCCCIFVLKV